ncbi:hypothetical protein HF925_01610 [Acidithiobacillus ferriphilus]|uniref:hypothetical protein n=1 Tax=Acidithiobacillus ferriphilus TaxID=1689834 RepID=UPI001C06FD2D|nr:hypothetical protein [Acidithiobacillus ferriphilus]MBU2847295.1 hypothetical protein [Acidithiobacillus ferriphilus]
MNLSDAVHKVFSQIRRIKQCLDECSSDISNEIAISYIPVLIYIPFFIFGFNVLHDFIVEISTLTVVYFSGATITVYRDGKMSSLFGYSVSFICVSSAISAIQILHSVDKIAIINHSGNIVLIFFSFSIFWFTSIKIYLSVKLCLDNKKTSIL